VSGERRRRRALAWPAGFVRTRADRDAALVLASLDGAASGRFLEVAQRERTATAVLGRVRRGEAGSEGDRAAALAFHREEVEFELRASAARFVVVGDDEYPAGLEHLADPPLALFVRGRPLRAGVGVAIVGARSCSALGRDVAHELGRRVASSGAPVVSGAARGIDSAAHEGALAASGVTIAVLGSGIAPVQPVGSRALVDRIVERGTVVSEYPPGVRPDAFRFPARNRIVAALARALVVVEGEADSGSLISAEHALDLGRDVFAVPGAVTSPLSAASHRLIREGAGLVRDADDLLADLGLDREEILQLPLDLPLAERAVLDAVRGPTLPDAVAREVGVGVPDALGLLMRLEVRGLVRSSGGRFERRFGASAAPATTEV